MVDKPDAPAKIEHRQIFLSHAHADRELASALKALVSEVYSGLVELFVSSDPSPSGGLQPGDEWFHRIHAQLRRSEAAWVLATEASVQHPWLYWEAGIARAICPAGVAVVRVGVDSSHVPSPLNAQQMYDGGARGPEGIDTMLGKVGSQLGMTIAPALLTAASKSWLDAVEGYSPQPVDDGTAVPVVPEQLGPIEALVSRLETAVRQTEQLTTSGRPRNRARVAAARIRLQRAEILGGKFPFMIDSADELVEALRETPATTIFHVSRIDEDGDVEVDASSEAGTQTNFYFRKEGEWYDDPVSTDALPEQAKMLIDEARSILGEASD